MFIKINENNVEKYLSIIENKKKYEFSFKHYFIEKALKTYLEKLIIINLLTEDKIVQFFDNNEFGFKNNIIYKKDIIDESSFYGTIKNNKALQTYISNEFKENFLDLLNESEINFDIENYVMVTTLVENNKNIRIYNVTFQYYRNFIYENFHKTFKQKIKKYILIGGISFLTLCGILFLTFKYII